MMLPDRNPIPFPPAPPSRPPRHGHRRRTSAVFFAAALCCTATACSEPLEKYPILDSGFVAEDHQTYWIDDQNVIFRGHEGRKPQTVEEQDRLVRGIFIWNLATNTVKKHANSESALCFGEGNVAYIERTLHPDRENVSEVLVKWREGPLGSEAVVFQPWPGPLGRRDWVRNPHTCKRDTRPTEMQGRLWEPLREGDGYIDGGPTGRHFGDMRRTVVLRDVRGNARADLDIPSEELASITHAPFLNAYIALKPFGHLTERGQAFWRKTGCWPIWSLKVNGETERLCIPLGPWSERTSFSAHLTRAGIFVRTLNSDSSYRAGKAGGYLVADGKQLHVVRGILDGTSVSPNGCRVAFAHAPYLEATAVGKPGERTLKSIQLCD